MSEQFFSREIKPALSEETRLPVSFRLDEREYKISEILESWHDHGFGRTAGRKRWWQRHHRNYYLVKADTGEVFQIYHDRGTSLERARKGKWFLTRRLSS